MNPCYNPEGDPVVVGGHDSILTGALTVTKHVKNKIYVNMNV